MTIKIPELLETMIERNYLKREVAENFVRYELGKPCVCGAYLLQDEEGYWTDLQGYRQNGTHTHHPLLTEVIQASHGLAFTPDLTHVALIENNTRDTSLLWHGKLMGLGGKVEPRESPLDSMIREFEEEGSVRTSPEDWQHYATLKGKGFEFACYCTDKIDITQVRTGEPDKPVRLYRLSTLYAGLNQKLYGNVRWLIEMALTMLNGQELRADKFMIEENV